MALLNQHSANESTKLEINNFSKNIMKTVKFDSGLDSSDDLSRPKKKRVILNVRGTKYDVIVNIFNKYPQSRLGRLSSLLLLSNEPSPQDLAQVCDDYDLNFNEFYFNKDPLVLNQVLNLYSSNNMDINTNRIHINENICFRYLSEQLSYWGLDFNLTVEKCCKMHLNIKNEFLNGELEREESIMREIEFKHDFGHRLFSGLRQRLFEYMEKPAESIAGIVRFMLI
jgi:hypothetical protein